LEFLHFSFFVFHLQALCLSHFLLEVCSAQDAVDDAFGSAHLSLLFFHRQPALLHEFLLVLSLHDLVPPLSLHLSFFHLQPALLHEFLLVRGRDRRALRLAKLPQHKIALAA
jgi:hypothetical protein